MAEGNKRFYKTDNYVEDPARTAALNELVAKGVFSKEIAAQIRKEDIQETLATIVPLGKDVSQFFANQKQGIQRVEQYRDESGVSEVIQQFKNELGQYSVSEYKDSRKQTINI